MDLQKFNKNRSMISEVLTGKEKKAEIAGWVHDSRSLGKIKFILVRDISGIVQITAVKGKVSEKVFEVMDKISRESVVYIKGKVVPSKQAPGGYEIIPEELEVTSEAEQPIPIDVSDFSKTELPKRLDYRFLDPRRREVSPFFKVRPGF